MIYIIDHKDSFTHNVVHQFSNFDKNIECENFNNIDYTKLNKANVIVFSPGPGEPKWLSFEFKDLPINIKRKKKL